MLFEAFLKSQLSPVHEGINIWGAMNTLESTFITVTSRTPHEPHYVSRSKGFWRCGFPLIEVNHAMTRRGQPRRRK
jgi:hypothetical protein